MKDTYIESLAHMLDESFNKIDDNNEMALPKDENTKFKFSDVIADGMAGKKLDELFTKIWPDWDYYVQDRIDKIGDVEVYGQQTDVDDWDVWKISISDVYGGVDGFVEFILDDLQERWPADKSTTLKEIIDAEIERLADPAEAQEHCDSNMLENNGVLVHKGQYRIGYDYPDR